MLLLTLVQHLEIKTVKARKISVNFSNVLTISRGMLKTAINSFAGRKNVRLVIVDFMTVLFQIWLELIHFQLQLQLCF